MASISVRRWKNKDGTPGSSHQVTYRGSTGKVERRSFVRKVDAKRFVETISQVRADPAPETKESVALPVMTSGLTFEDAARDYLEACRVGRSGGDPIERATLESYTCGLQLHVFPVLGHKILSSLKPRDIREFRDIVSAMDRSRRSKRLYLFLAKSVLSHAIEQEWIETNPGSDIKLQRSKRLDVAPASTKIRIHSREEVGRMLSTARLLIEESADKREWKRWRLFEPMLHTMIFSGLRMSELRGLPCEAVDLPNQTIRVFQRADRFEAIGPPKSVHSYRTIHISADLAKRLGDWMNGRTTGLVFPTRNDSTIQLTNIYRRMWIPLQHRAGVTILNPHCARHFFASMLIHQGARMKALQEAMGHHDPMFTMRVYGHLFTDSEDVALAKDMATRMHASITQDDDED